MAVLRGLHWAQHYCMALTVLSVLWFVVRRGEADWPLAGMTAFAPTLMRAGCGYDRRGAGEELSARFLQPLQLRFQRQLCRKIVGNIGAA